MPRLKHDFELKAARVAWQWCQERPQTEIAKSLELSQSTISRMIDYAKEQGWLTERRIFHREQLPESVRSKLDEGYSRVRELEESLKQLSPNPKFNLTVLQARDINAFCEMAAQRVASVLVSSRVIGVTGGTTVSRVIEGVRSQYSKPGSSPQMPVKCIPLCGETVMLVHQHDLRFSASQLAADLETALTGQTEPTLPTLVGVPAYVASAFHPRNKKSGAQNQSVLDFLRGTPGYQEIFGPRKDKAHPLAKSICTILTGVGVIEPEGSTNTGIRGRCLEERLVQEPDLSPTKLRRWIFGEIGGVILDRPNIDEIGKRWVEKLNRGWIGFDIDLIRHVARQGTELRSPGVIVVAFGSEKAECVRAAVERGLVNELIIDSSLADSL